MRYEGCGVVTFSNQKNVEINGINLAVKEIKSGKSSGYLEWEEF